MFWIRLISGITLVLLAFLTLITGGIFTLAVLFVISVVAYRELVKAMGVLKEEKINGLEIIGYVGITVYYFFLYFNELNLKNLMIMTVVFTMLLMMFWYVCTFPKYHINQVLTCFGAFFYAPVMLSFIYMAREMTYGNYIVWLIIICSWGCDTCAYAVGMSFGKTIGNHKIFPKLSPKKSLEGCIGGVLGAALIGGLYGFYIVETVVVDTEITLQFALICGVGAVFSQMGDLVASAIKRNHNIKDYGKIIPGHGGIMDRFDSMIVTAPLIYFAVNLFICV